MRFSVAQGVLIGLLTACGGEWDDESSQTDELPMFGANSVDRHDSAFDDDDNEKHELRPIVQHPHAKTIKGLNKRIQALIRQHGKDNPAPLFVGDFIQKWSRKIGAITPTAAPDKVAGVRFEFNTAYMHVIQKKSRELQKLLNTVAELVARDHAAFSCAGGRATELHLMAQSALLTELTAEWVRIQARVPDAPMPNSPMSLAACPVTPAPPVPSLARPTDVAEPVQDANAIETLADELMADVSAFEAKLAASKLAFKSCRGKLRECARAQRPDTQSWSLFSCCQVDEQVPLDTPRSMDLSTPLIP